MQETATFALGCFWRPEGYFSKLYGVVSTRVGYTGGTTPNPTYHDLGGHTESVEIQFDPSEISYQELLKHFRQQHNPTFHRNRQYRSAIFTHGEEQYRSKQEVQKQYGKAVVTEIVPAATFYPAEEYHQKYYTKTGKSGIC